MAVFRKRGYWYLDYRVDGKRKRRRVGRSARRAELEHRIIKGEITGPREPFQRGRGPLVETVVAKFQEWLRAYHRPRWERGAIEQFKQYFHGKRLRAITPQLIERYKRDRRAAARGRRVRPWAIPRELMCLRRLFNLAIRWGLAKTNPVRAVAIRRRLLKPPLSRRSDTRRPAMDPDIARRVEVAIEYSRRHRLPYVNRRFEVATTEAEAFNAKIEARQAAWLRDFDQAAGDARPVLQRLAEAGEADLVWVLDQVLRCAEAKSAKVPRPRLLSFKPTHFRLAPLPPTGAHTPDGMTVLTARKQLRGGSHRRGALGPAEMINSLKMALLARRFRKTTRDPRYKEIAALFRAFAFMIWRRPCHSLKAGHIRRRVLRIKREHGAELRRQIGFGETHRKALAYDFQIGALPEGHNY